MSPSPSMPPKEDVAKEIGRIASTLTEDMQSAALKKARDLGFDLTRGRLSLEETLINLTSVRDALLDAAEKAKLIHLPLKLQYTLYSQTLKVSETLTSLVNSTDAVQALEDVVEELMSSVWQYNLQNLSDEVLGFQKKMNQLKNQEVLIRKAHRDAQEFEASSERARTLLQEIESVLTNAKDHGDTIKTDLEQTSATLTKATEAAQKVAGLAIQAEQHEANAKAASAATQTIADKLPAVKAEIETAKSSLDELEVRIKKLLSTFDQSSTTALTDLQNRYDEVKNTTEAATTRLLEEITKQSEELTISTDKLLKGAADQLATFQADHDQKLNVARDAINKTAHETIEKVDSEFRTALNEQDTKHETQRTTAQKEYDRLVAELDKLEDQIKDSIRRATGFTLFHSFQKRQEDLVASKNFWANTLAVVVIISLCLSFAFIVYLHFNPSEFGPAFYLKLSISLPIIYAIWFCSIQYSRERRLEEEYAFKSNISISLDPYRELVEKLVVRDKPEEMAKYTAFVIESVGRVFTSPTETAFDHTKDATPTEGAIKAAGDLAKDIIKLVKRW